MLREGVRRGRVFVLIAESPAMRNTLREIVAMISASSLSTMPPTAPAIILWV